VSGPVRELIQHRHRPGDAAGGFDLESPAREPESTIADHVWTVVEGRWTVAAVAAFCLGSAAAYLFVAAPVCAPPRLCGPPSPST